MTGKDDVSDAPQPAIPATIAVVKSARVAERGHRFWMRMAGTLLWLLVLV